MTLLVYDNTFEGFLTAIFEVYEFTYQQPKLVKDKNHTLSLLDETVDVFTDEKKAHRVLFKIEKAIGKIGVKILLYAFLSEENESEKQLFEVIKYIIQSPEKNVMNDFSNPHVMQVHKLSRSVAREKHRMEAFVRFEELSNGIYFSKIAPDFDVLMLILNHFKNRYQDQEWIIYDIRRNYGLYYNLKKVEIMTLDMELKNIKTNQDLLSDTELKYQNLWKEYFDHTNITERKNMKLHVQHLPKMYWKYLTEKRDMT